MTSAASESSSRAPVLARRTASGIAMAAVVFGSVASLPAFTVVVLAITLLSLWELAGLSARKGQGLSFAVAAPAVAAYVILAALGTLHRYEAELIGATVVAALGVALFGARNGYVARSAYTLLGVLYIGKLGAYFVTLRVLPGVGSEYVVAAIVLIAVTDIGAMLIGTAFGRTPLSPISPRKTWEGAVGGFASAVAAGLTLAAASDGRFPLWQGALIGALTSIAAQAGDLVESAIKRDAAVKDAGRLLGEHGGVLDRFDSYTFGGIAFYGAMYVTGHIPMLHGALAAGQ